MEWSRERRYSMGMQSLLKDMGIDATIHTYTDSSAAKGIATRKGLGKVRHSEVNQLWLQGKIHEGTITVDKTAGIHNQAYMFTKQITANILEEHIKGLTHRIGGDRHHLMPSLSSKSSRGLLRHCCYGRA